MWKIFRKWTDKYSTCKSYKSVLYRIFCNHFNLHLLIIFMVNIEENRSSKILFLFVSIKLKIDTSYIVLINTCILVFACWNHPQCLWEWQIFLFSHRISMYSYEYCTRHTLYMHIRILQSNEPPVNYQFGLL